MAQVDGRAPSSASPTRSTGAEADTRALILVLGDSLSAAFGIDIDQGWVALLERRLRQRELDWRVVNASVSGETTHGAVSRIDAELARLRPDVVLIELGGNDGLRGLSLQQTEQNLRTLIERSLAANARPLLLAVRLPPNLGPIFTERFRAIYQRLAGEFGIEWVPYLLAGVAAEPGMMQSDGIHPTAQAQPIMLDNVWGALARTAGFTP
ncbi:MAG: arylesterase [Gammaproteobacteria bacterium]|nr:arylesterase [Gammaproteobacteria bacterium]